MMFAYVNRAASCVASLSLPRDTVAPFKLVREYDSPSPIVSVDSG